jgi:hypothetical protein
VRWLVAGAAIVAVLPLALAFDVFRAALRDSYVVVQVAGLLGLPTFQCSDREFGDLYVIWRSLVSVLALGLVTASLVAFPYSTTGTLRSRAPSPRGAVFSMLTLGLFTWLFGRLVTALLVSCNVDGVAAGHAKLILTVATSSPFGLAVVGTTAWLLWVLCALGAALCALLFGSHLAKAAGFTN